MATGFAKHLSYYTLASVLVTLASVVSFPLLTRLLTVEEYGVMNLVASALAILVGVAKLGLGNAALRFYSEVKAGKHGVDMNGYASTVVLGMSALGVFVTLAWLAATLLMPASWWSDPRVGPLMSFTSVLVLVRVLESALLNQVRAQEESRTLAVFGVVRRYLGLAAIFGVLFFVSRDLWGFYGATVATEILGVAWIAVWLLRRFAVTRAGFNGKLFKAMLAFGIPMAGYELGAQVLAVGDRYVIQSLLGAQPLGIYVAAYNMCDYVKILALSSFAAAAIPTYSRLWEEHGVEETAAFLRRFLHVYVAAAAFVVALTAATGGQVLAVLASEKYRAGEAVVPWVIGGMALEGVVMVCGAGLYLTKRSKTIMALVAGAALLNVGLNLLWVPGWGIVGSALATLVSYAALLLSSMLLGRGTLPIALPWLALLKFGIAALAAWAAARGVSLGGDVVTGLLRGVIVTTVFGALALGSDAALRGRVGQAAAKLRARFGARPT